MFRAWSEDRARMRDLCHRESASVVHDHASVRKWLRARGTLDIPDGHIQ
jgi:hypothetical protein